MEGVNEGNKLLPIEKSFWGFEVDLGRQKYFDGSSET